MTCCEDERSEIKTPIKLGKGSLRARVKALGNSVVRACWAKSPEWMRSEICEKRVVRVNPIFCCHTYIHFEQQILKKLIKSINYKMYFTLSSVDWSVTG